MSIKEKYSVIRIKPQETYDWLIRKHYAGRLPSISYAFGLYGPDLCGVLTIGKPASPFICKGVCGDECASFVFELNRLCVNEGLERNILSYFVGATLRLLSDDLIIVSYADTAYGHHGYIYQATNWIYTGATKERTDIGDDNGQHSRHYSKDLDYSTHRMFRSSKHRYVYFIGKRRKEFHKALRYEIQPYPKGDNQRYDASYQPMVQARLF